MAVSGFEEFLIQKPKNSSGQPMQPSPTSNGMADLSQFKIETPYSVQQTIRPNIQGPVYTREGYQLPPSDDPFADSAKQAGFGALRGAGGAPGNLLDLVVRGGSWVANKLGAPEEITQQAGNLTKQLFNLPTTQDINQKFVDSGINPYAQTGIGRVVGQGAEAVANAAALGVPGAAIPAIGLGGSTGQTIRELGLPEWLATGADLIISADPRNLAKNIFRPAASSSGLPQRGFAKVTSPTKVSEGTKRAIVQNLEDDFKQVSNRILGTQESVQAIRNNPGYRQQLNQDFEKVQTLAAQIPENINTKEIQASFNNQVKTQPYRGYADSEFEKAFQRQSKAVDRSFGVTPETTRTSTLLDQYGKPIKQTIPATGKEVPVSNVVEQYRKNNQQLTEYFEPGKSGAVNRAKKAALLEHNKAITNTLEKKFPNSEFVNTFKKSNANFEKLMQYEYVDEQIGKAFGDSKINFKQLEKQLDNTAFQRNLKGLVGEGVQKEYNGLIREFISLQDPYKLLRAARKKGLAENIITFAAPYLFGPKIGATGTVIKGLVFGVNAVRQALLRNPRIIKDWRQGIINFKKGNYPAAIRAFQEVERQSQPEPQTQPNSQNNFTTL